MTERQCESCGSFDGDPYAILSNGFCLPCDVDARILCGMLPEKNERQEEA